MSWYPVFVYLLSFSAACLFGYGAYRVIKDIQQVPIEEEGWFGVIADSSIRGNPLFRLMMFVVKLLARINVTWNLGAYEVMMKKKLDAAGRPWDLKPAEYLGIKEASSLLLSLLAFGFYLILPGFSFFVIVLVGVLGFILPNFFVNQRIKERQVSILQDLLGTDSLNTGFSLPDDSMHGPDERLHLPTWYRGIEMLIHFFFNLGAEGGNIRKNGT